MFTIAQGCVSSRTPGGIYQRGNRLQQRKGMEGAMAYEPHSHDSGPVEPDRGSLTGYAAIKYTALVIIVLAVILFLAWVLINFIGD